jgi:hypothetical protein
MMSEPSLPPLFNNADSFAAAFDEAWKSHSEHEINHGLANHEKLLLILNQLADHPFVQADSAMAHKVGEFRIRLLDL